VSLWLNIVGLYNYAQRGVDDDGRFGTEGND